ncbi:hypothetical protein [Enterobacter kobei]|uniref:hypothetical protein n=1 Tax=Enterobacter kobei TaxID=208224 RepID=UPI002AD47A60|nr:hypothetical protein [Enterobacter kobei]
MKYTLWESWEKLFLYEVGSTMPIPVIAEKLERTEKAIISMAHLLKIPLMVRPRGREWTQAELFLLGRFSPEEIARATGRSLASVRWKIKSLTRESGGKIMREWATEELALLWRHSNEEVAEITGRSIKEVGDRRLQENLERNGWDKHNPEAVTKWEAA